jgi:hypothetical protein
MLAVCSFNALGCSSTPSNDGQGNVAGAAGSSSAGAGGSPSAGSGNALAGMANGGAGSGSSGAAGDSSGGAGASSGGAGASSSGGGGSSGASSGGGGGPAAGAGGAAGLAGAAGAGGQDMYPLLKVLPLFTASDVPVRGPQEAAPSKQNWTPPATLPVRTGKGIAQHPMLYVGENYNRIILVNEGKVIWTYDTTPGYELDDVWMLSNGDILYSHMTFIEEITPKKEVVWHYKPASGEIHTVQPIGFDRVLFVENALPMARVRIYNKKTAMFEVDHQLAAGASQHGEFRRFRITGAGTYLGSFLEAGKVVEYDKDFNIIWSYVSPAPWSSVRLKNGHTLIQDETQSASKEVDSTGKVVWQLAKSELTLPAGTQMGNTQSCERLASGNTVMFGNGGTNVNNIQAVEVTPDKQVVWVLQDWMHLGDATSAQFLDEPGFPEVPGDTNH